MMYIQGFNEFNLNEKLGVNNEIEQFTELITKESKILIDDIKSTIDIKTIDTIHIKFNDNKAVVSYRLKFEEFTEDSDKFIKHIESDIIFNIPSSIPVDKISVIFELRSAGNGSGKVMFFKGGISIIVDYTDNLSDLIPIISHELIHTLQNAKVPFDQKPDPTWMVRELIRDITRSRANYKKLGSIDKISDKDRIMIIILYSYMFSNIEIGPRVHETYERLKNTKDPIPTLTKEITRVSTLLNKVMDAPNLNIEYNKIHSELADRQPELNHNMFKNISSLIKYVKVQMSKSNRKMYKMVSLFNE